MDDYYREELDFTDTSVEVDSRYYCQGLYGNANTPSEEVSQVLADHLDRIVEDYQEPIEQGKCKVELECRLGVVLASNRQNRLTLPIVGSALLESPSREFGYGWHGGITKMKHRALLTKVRELLNLVDNPKNKDSKKTPLSEEIHLQTEDEIVQVQTVKVDLLTNEEPISYRRSYLVPKTPTSVPIECVRKENLITLHIYMGQDKDEGNDLHDTGNMHKENENVLVDVRIAIALEWECRTEYRHLPGKVIHNRKRNRKSFPLFGSSVIDATEVVTSSMDPSGRRRHEESKQESYEFEIEINHDTIIDGIKKLRGDPHDESLRNTLGNVIRLIRGCADFLNGNEGAGSGSQLTDTTTDLSDMKVEPELLGNYLRFVSPVTPLIGDYLYRAIGVNIADLHKNAIEKGIVPKFLPLSETEIMKGKQFGLTDADRVELNEERLRRAAF